MRIRTISSFGSTAIIAVLAAITAISGSLLSVNESPSASELRSDTAVVATRTTVSPSAVVELATARTDSTLPIGSVEVHKAENEQGIAVLIPQTHKYPGTTAADSKNDSAEVAQGEIYDILAYLYDRYGIDLIMTEGDMYGSTTPDKVARVRTLAQLRDDFAGALEKFRLASSGEPKAERLITQAETALKALDREIILTGAPYLLPARGRAVTLVGAERPDTYATCATVVKDYIYQKDQRQACEAGEAVATTPSAEESAGSSLAARLQKLRSLIGTDAQASEIGPDLQSILSQLQNKNDLDTGLEALAKDLASAGKGEAAEAARALQAAYEAIEQVDQDATVSVDSNGYGTNPYAHITDTAELDRLIDRSEEDIQALVIDRRNRETAENLALALEERGESVGVIQFGAGHEEGLTKELNAQGLTVVVVKPDEVLRRESTDNETASIKKLIQNQ